MEFEQFENLTEEQKAKLRECKTKEELVSLAQEDEVELSDDMLEAIAGGEWECSNVAPCREWSECDQLGRYVCSWRYIS